MEGRLFGVAIWCWLYGRLIRWIDQHDDWIRRRSTAMFLNALFWATGGALLGMLRGSYSDSMEDTLRFAVIYALVGVALGLVTGYLTRSDEKREEMMADNLEWADTGFSAILLASAFMFFVVQAFKIPSGSMRMTFVEGDHLFVNKFIYGLRIPFTDKKVLSFRPVEHGDIVIFRYPAKSKDDRNYGRDFIKRAIGMPGQTIEVRNKTLLIDGKPQTEPYAQYVDPVIFPSRPDMDPAVYQHVWETGGFAEIGGNEIRDNFGPVKVPPGHIFVMGDNRDRSYDSRFWGPLDVSAVKGRAWLLYWPLNRFRLAR